MELNNISLSDFTRLADIIFEKERQSLNQAARNSGLFQVESIPMNSGNTREYTEVDLEEYATVKSQGDQAARAKVQQGYNKVITSYRVAKDIGITYEMRTQNKYPEVVRRLTNLAGLAVNRMDLDLTHRITFGDAVSYTDQDGRTIDTSVGDTLALFSTVHTVKGSATTYRNILAGNPQYSKSALEGMERLVVEETINQFGQKMVIPFDILFTTDDPNTINQVLVDLRSMAATDAGLNSGVLNPYKAKYKHVILPRIATTADGSVDSTKRKYWGLGSSYASTGHLAIWEEPHLKVPSDLNAGEEFSTDDWNFGVRAGWGVCVVNGVWVKISYGTGAA